MSNSISDSNAAVSALPFLFILSCSICCFSNSGELTKTPVYDGNKLSAGHQINGPAVVEEDTTTLVIEPGWLLELHKSGTYFINRKD